MRKRQIGRTTLRGWKAFLWIIPAAFALGCGVQAGEAAAEPSGEADRVPASEGLAASAFQEAMRYVSVVHHTPDGERVKGMLYHFGGQDTVVAFLKKKVNGNVDEAGIDASGLVVNVYRAVVPGLEFWWDAEGSVKRADAASSTLFHYNVQPVEFDGLHPGDLLFFGSSPDRVNGVALYREVRDGVVRFVSASASEGRVVETGAVLNGAYWENHFVGAGRLLVPSSPPQDE